MYGSTGESQRDPLLGNAAILEGTEQSDAGQVPVVHKNNLGVFNGVFVPCLLNILGVVLFLRIGFAVGYTGMLGVFLMFAVGELVAMLTVLSMSALVSNGNMRGGGNYYLISRCLGAEFGGSIGFCFMLSYSIGSSFYCIGFASAVVDAFLADEDMTSDEKQMYNRLISSIVLALVMIISYLGAEFFTKINGIIFALQFLSIFIGIFSMWFQNPIEELENGGSFTGFSLDTMRENLWTNFTYDEKCGGVCSWRTVFGIIFPGVTGISEGANLSGDLRNPNRDIGRGTIAAVAAAISTYAILIVSIAGGFPRDTLKTNMNIMANVAWPSKFCIIGGIAISSFSSALGSVFGGSRLLQALARDDLPPKLGLKFFAKGSQKGDEPRRAVLFVWLVSECCCLIGDLDVVSPIITSFFLVSYGAINLTCFMMDVSGTPNFRPQFRYYSRSQCFFAFSLCLILLFFIDVWYAVTACGVLFFLYIWIAMKAPVKSWGDVSQSIMYHQVRKYLLRLDIQDHPKNWRPSLLLLLGPGTVNFRVVDFCNSLKKGGLYSIGDVVLGDMESCAQDTNDLRANWIKLVKDLNIKAIPEVTFGPTLRLAYQQLVGLSGLGGMRPNCVVLLLPSVFGSSGTQDLSYREKRQGMLLREESFADVSRLSHRASFPLSEADVLQAQKEIPVFEKESDFLDVVRDIVHHFKRNLLLVCNFDRESNSNKKASFIDVWVVGNSLYLDGRLSLQFQLAHILHLERKCEIRLLNVVDEFCDLEEQRAKVQDLAIQARMLNVSFQVIACRGIQTIDEIVHSKDLKHLAKELNRTIGSYSSQNTRVSFIGLPEMPTAKVAQNQQRQESQEADADYLQSLHHIVNGLGPTVLVQSGIRTNLIPAGL